MTKKRKTQLAIIIAIMVLLGGFVIYSIGKTIYEYVDIRVSTSKTIEKFDRIYEEKGTKVILFASPTCKWCKQFVPVLDSISKENNFKYEYIDISHLFKEDLNKLYEKINMEYKGIPHLIILDNQTVVGSQVGAESENATIELLKKVGIIKGDVENDESISVGS